MNQLVVQTLNHSATGPAPKVFDFLNVQLRPQSGYCISTEFPALFGDYPGGYSCVATVNSLVAGHVGFVAREFLSPGARMKIGLIGSVVTAPEFRSLGIASRLITRAMEELKTRGSVVACLWSDDPKFYESFGFFSAGREVDLRIDPSAIPDDIEPTIDFNEQLHARWIWRLYQKHALRVDRSLEEQIRLTRIPNTRIFLTLRGEEVTSYIAINKGMDFKDYIHEWGGEMSEVQRNIGGTQKHFFKSTPLTLIAPQGDDLSKIRALSSEEGRGVVGSMAVLDRKMLKSHYFSFLKKNNIDHSATESKIRFEKLEAPFESPRDILMAVFGDASEPRHPVMPFFLWGFDSI